MSKTYWYGDENQRLRAAQGMYEDFCARLATDGAQARTQLIARIQVALGQAYSQGIKEAQQSERWDEAPNPLKSQD